MEQTSAGKSVHPCNCLCHSDAKYRCGGNCCTHTTAKAAVIEYHVGIQTANERALALTRKAYAGKDITISIDGAGHVLIDSNTREFHQAAPVTFPDQDPKALERLLLKWDQRHDAYPERADPLRPRIESPGALELCPLPWI